MSAQRVAELLHRSRMESAELVDDVVGVVEAATTLEKAQDADGDGAQEALDLVLGGRQELVEAVLGEDAVGHEGMEVEVDLEHGCSSSTVTQRCSWRRMARVNALRAAAVLLWLNGIGFGVFCPPAIRSLQQGHGIPRVMGFPAYGSGSFERHGVRTTVPLLLGFLAVCILECLAGALLWGGYRSGAILSLALLPAGAVFWWGFDLPVPWVLAAARTVLIVVSWRQGAC